jgi:nicotinamidase/pyrazinamidase
MGRGVDHATGSYDAGTALVVVDVQNDFADPSGSLYVRGGEAVVAAVNDEVTAAIAAGALVAYTQDWHPPQTPHFQSSGGVWPEHCVRETWGAAFHPELTVADDAVFVRKGTEGEDGYSGFTVRDPTTGDESATGLAAALAEHDVERVVVVGLATDYCVAATALDAAKLGFDTTVLQRAVGAVDLEPGDGERALQEMAGAGIAVA